MPFAPSATSRNTMLAHSIGLSGELLLRSPISLWIEEDEGPSTGRSPGISYRRRGGYRTGSGY